MPGPLVTTLAYTYCTQADMEAKLSISGVEDRIDDADDDVITAQEQQRITNAIVAATDTINLYCEQRYSTAKLATSNWVNRLATCLACYDLCEGRGNTPPEAIQVCSEKAQDLLEKIQEGKLNIPGLAMKRSGAPSMDNAHADPGFIYKVIRVERRSSTRHDPTSLPVQTDYREQMTQEP